MEIYVLRITLPKPGDNPRVFLLEGRLAGEWAKELLGVVREIRPGIRCVFDLENVFYVDSLGEEILRSLNRLGAAFLTETAYGKDLCERLDLRRVDVTRPDAQEYFYQRKTRKPEKVAPHP